MNCSLSATSGSYPYEQHLLVEIGLGLQKIKRPLAMVIRAQELTASSTVTLFAVKHCRRHRNSLKTVLPNTCPFKWSHLEARAVLAVL